MTSATLAADAWSSAPKYVAAVTWSGQHDAAVLLEGGKKVLVAGGADAASLSVKHSAVYDFETKTWSQPAQLGTARQQHALVALPGGKALITGGFSAPGGPALATAEVFDPVTNKWTPVPKPMKAGRWGHSAAKLSNGLILIAGGSTLRPGGKAMALRTAELFKPDATATEDPWTQAEDMTDARTGHVAVVLQDGKTVLVCGGSTPVGSADDPALAFCELYDTETKKWKPAATMHYPRSGHTATALSGTSVLVTGGKAPGVTADGAFDPFARDTAEVFDFTAAGGSWKDVKSMPGGRAFHRAVAVGAGKVAVFGGADDVTNEAGYRSAIQYEAGNWTSLPGLTIGRWGFAAAAAGAEIVVAGGIASTGLAAAEQPAEPGKRALELTMTAEKFGSSS
ncbi:Kelch-like protein 17 [Kibdelosporangium aridum]|uniref:Kelch-like protein 17 n=1 Tax=Kibdelosporangium aridum TaxID=2030 RepID=A0A428Z2P3_KIBAR|nr:kelch repeat-containing protein [Kibdelosporangium aridum]RSM79991.1 Kelch-like protein 17 [Kibdelosporangium aridum]